jgi:two-component system sensor histidine kinase/response regulator
LQILAAEDNRVNQRLLLRLLQKEGHTVTLAEDGEAAIAISEEQDFDVILMDVQMPAMDGLEATRYIRNRERESGRHVPIIALTAHAMKGDRERCLDAGMDAYVAKPVQKQELLHIIYQYASHGGGERPVTLGAAAHEDGVLDLSAALERCGGDEGVVRELCELFLGEEEKLAPELARALEQGDKAGMSASAHKLKTSAGTIGGVRAYHAAAALEAQARSGEQETIMAAAAQLQRELAGLKTAVAKFLARAGVVHHENSSEEVARTVTEEHSAIEAAVTASV